jgi:hypothetical protein
MSCAPRFNVCSAGGADCETADTAVGEAGDVVAAPITWLTAAPRGLLPAPYVAEPVIEEMVCVIVCVTDVALPSEALEEAEP